MASKRAVRLGASLRALRQAKGMSQQEVADLLGWSQSSLGRLETGFHEPTLDRLFTLAAFFEVDAGDLIKGEAGTPLPEVVITGTVVCEECGVVDSGLSREKAKGIRADHIRKHAGRAD